MAYCIAFITVPDSKTGQAISRALVEQRLAACVNRVPGLHSVYRWQGKVEEAAEELLIVKTEKTRVKAVVKAVKALHPYSMPEIISLRIKDGSRDYLRWIGESVDAKKASPRTRGKKARARKQSHRDLKKNARQAKAAKKGVKG